VSSENSFNVAYAIVDLIFSRLQVRSRVAIARLMRGAAPRSGRR
jgi:hypothetical protein